MAEWKTIPSKKLPDMKGSILIAGLPGIGNVGKIVVDFLVDELKAKKVCEFFSYHMPHSVFVNEKNLVELPKIELYFVKKKNTKLLILSGDAQPNDEASTYAFCDAVLDFFEKHKGEEIITLGGIGLNSIPKVPKVYSTGNNKEIVKRYKKGTKTQIYGVVGPIIGVSGLLLGLSEKRKIKAVSLLAETLAHPMFLGLKGSREILKLLNKQFDLYIDLKNIEKEIKEFESKMKISSELRKASHASKKSAQDINYIG